MFVGFWSGNCDCFGSRAAAGAHPSTLRCELAPGIGLEANACLFLVEFLCRKTPTDVVRKFTTIIVVVL